MLRRSFERVQDGGIAVNIAETAKGRHDATEKESRDVLDFSNWQSPISMTLSEMTEQAQVLLDDGKLTAAREAFGGLVESHPHATGGYKGLAEVALRSEDWGELDRVARLASQQFPQHSWWHSYLGKAAQNTGALATIEGCSEILQVVPSHALALSLRGDLFLSEGRFAEAQQDFESSRLEHPGSPTGLRGLLEIAAIEERWSDAANVGRLAQAEFPDHRWWRQTLGSALEQLDCDEAASYYEAILASDPHAEWAASRLHSLLGANDQVPRLLGLYDRYRFVGSAWWISGRGRALEQLGEPESAFVHYRMLVAPDAADAVWSGLARTAVLVGRTEEALAECDGTAANPSTAMLMARASLYEANGDITEALASLEEISEEPAAVSRRFAEILDRAGRHTEAVDYWEKAVALDPTLYTRRRLADSLRLDHRFDVALAHFEELSVDFPDDPTGLVGQGKVSGDLWHFEQNRSAWAVAYERFPHHQVVVDNYIRALTEVSDFDRALGLLVEERAKAASPDRVAQVALAEASLENKRFNFTRARELIELATLVEGVSTQRLDNALVALGDIAKRCQDNPGLVAEAKARLKGLADPSLSARLRLAELHVADAEPDSAALVLEALSPTEKQSSQALPLLAWRETHRRQHESAALLGKLWLERTYRPQIHGPIDDFRFIGGPSSIQVGRPVVISVVRDEMLRLPDFLRHHRNIGVESFVVIDNGSTDGTFEYLAEQVDVTLYQTADDYFLAGMGMRWVNHLMDTLVADHWCLFLDADELFVSPGVEVSGLGPLINYLEGDGYNAVAGYMLDMHPATYFSQREVAPGERLVDASPWFTNSYDFQPFTVSPYTDVRGGFRAAILGERYRQHTKTPLVKSSSGVRFLLSAHETTPSIVADITAALLHFKFSGDAKARSAKEVEWTDHFYYTARARGLAELASDALEKGDIDFLGPKSERFEDSAQLERLGLIQRGRYR